MRRESQHRSPGKRSRKVSTLSKKKKGSPTSTGYVIGSLLIFFFTYYRFLNYIFRADNYVIPKADVPTAFKAIYTNPDHVTQALHYFVINEQRLRKE